MTEYVICCIWFHKIPITNILWFSSHLCAIILLSSTWGDNRDLLGDADPDLLPPAFTHPSSWFWELSWRTQVKLKAAVLRPSIPASSSKSVNVINSHNWLVRSSLLRIPQRLLWTCFETRITTTFFFVSVSFFPRAKSNIRLDHRFPKLYMKGRERQTGQQGEACCLPHLNSTLQYAIETGQADTDSSSPTHCPGQTMRSWEKGQWKGREGHLPAASGTQLSGPLAPVLRPLCSTLPLKHWILPGSPLPLELVFLQSELGLGDKKEQATTKEPK